VKTERRLQRKIIAVCAPNADPIAPPATEAIGMVPHAATRMTEPTRPNIRFGVIACRKPDALMVQTTAASP